MGLWKVSEEDEVVTLLGSLPGSYATLVTALEARVDDVKMDFVQQALPHEESKPRSKNVSMRNVSALMRDEYGVFSYSSKLQPYEIHSDKASFIQIFADLFVLV